jgi:hypothetical protein
MPANNYKDRKLIQVTGTKGDPGPVGPAGAAGVGTPTGGTAGQILAKLSSTNYDFTWTNPGVGATGTGFVHSTSGVPDAATKLVDTADINANQVTLAKMAQVTTGTVFYRKTSGTGDPELQTLATLKTDLGLTGTNSGDQTSVSGNAGTATAFQTARTINGVSFDGTANITVADSTKELVIAAGTTGQYWRGDKAWQTLNQDAVPDGTTNKAFTATNQTKLAGIASGATANSSDATLLARSNHTGIQTASTISDFSTAADARISAAILDALSDVIITTPTNGQVLKHNGTNWVNGTDATGGGLAAGTGVIDFGSGNDTASVVITDASVSTSSKITLSLYFNTSLSLGRDVDEMLIDPITLIAVPGTGNFTVHGAALQGTVVGKYGISYTAA